MPPNQSEWAIGRMKSKIWTRTSLAARSLGGNEAMVLQKKRGKAAWWQGLDPVLTEKGGCKYKVTGQGRARKVCDL